MNIGKYQEVELIFKDNTKDWVSPLAKIFISDQQICIANDKYVYRYDAASVKELYINNCEEFDVVSKKQVNLVELEHLN